MILSKKNLYKKIQDAVQEERRDRQRVAERDQLHALRAALETPLAEGTLVYADGKLTTISMVAEIVDPADFSSKYLYECAATPGIAFSKSSLTVCKRVLSPGNAKGASKKRT